MPKPSLIPALTELMSQVGLKPGALASKVGVSPVAVSKWMRGLNEPSAEVYLKLGRLVGPPGCWFFWERAGLRKGDLAMALPEEAQRYGQEAPVIEVVAAPGALQQGSSRLKKRPDAVAIPLLHDAAAAGSPRMIEQAEVEQTLVIPRAWCPHPQHTTCIRVSGRSMYPVLDDGYVVAVDSFVTDPDSLIERMVAAQDSDGGVTIKWLRKVSGEFMLLPQHTSPEYPPVLISRETGWNIVGEVIWWIGQPPK